MRRTESPAQYLAGARNAPRLLQLPGTGSIELHPDPQHDLVALGGYIQAGRLYDPEHQQGLCSLMAQLIASDRLRHDPSVVFASSADRINLNFSLKCLGEDALGCATSLILNLRTPTEAPDTSVAQHRLDLQKQSLVRAILVKQRQASNAARRVLQQLSYPEGHPYHHSDEGDVQHIADATAGALRTFHMTQVLSSPLTLVISGNFDPEAMQDRLLGALEGWRPSDQPKPQVSLPTLSYARGKQVRVARSTSSLHYLLLGQASIGRDHPAWTSHAIMNHLLGRAAGGGRVGARLRRQHGAVYSLDCQFEGGWRTGLWRCGGWFRPEDVALACAVVTEELTRLQEETVQPEDLEGSRSAISTAIMKVLSTHAGLVRERLGARFYGLGEGHIQQTQQRLQQVTAQDVQDAARSLRPTALHRIVVG